ncbi:hypothetical protein ACIPVB_06370 [Microbacterium sp. NPDC090007]|uniref:hypothetical protein n=1 Tax=Microbacterium sp. NPDC090007 TaxID=3364204 RepID=UPI00382ACAD0
MNPTQIDPIPENVVESVTQLSLLLQIRPDEVGERFAQITVGTVVLMLSPDALDPYRELPDAP